jgi:phage gp29-like protein
VIPDRRQKSSHAATPKVSTAALREEIARSSQTGLRSVWQWRPLASLTPAAVADLLRRAAMGDARDFLIAADDIREKDLHYAAVLQTRTLAVSGLPVDIQPWDDSRAAKKAAALAQDVLREGDFAVLIAHLMDAVAKGYAVAEIVWETSGSTWYPREIIPRPAHWFTFDRDSGRLLRLVDGSPEGADIPPYRMIAHQPPIHAGIPLLGGVARSALWAWVFKSYAMRDWARFCELFGQPIRVGKYHQGASPDDVAVLRRAAFELGSDAAAVIPQEMVLELIESGSKSASADLYHRLIDYLDRQVSKAVLGQTMTTDSGSSGSLAQAKVHEQVRRELLEADARAMAATLTRDLIAPIVRLNLGEDAPLPTLKLLVEDPEDLSMLADHVVKLTQAGLPIPQWWVREKFGIPEVAEGEAVLGQTPLNPAQPDPAGLDPAAQARHVHAFDATPHAQQAAAPDELARLVDEAMADWQPMVEPLADAVQALLDAAAEQGLTADEVSRRLAEALPGLPVEALAEKLARAQFAARLAGVHGREPEGGHGR